MDSTDDDFGDLYADVEVAASSAINGGLELANSPIKDEKDEIFKSPRCSDDEFEENGSDSEDDFDIVLNDDDCDGLEISRMRNGDEEENEGKEVGEEAKDGSDKSRMCLDNLETGDRRNVVKVVNSQYKYMRPQSSTLASTLKSSKCEGPASYSCPSLKGEQEDTGLYHGLKPKAQGQSVHQFSLPRSRTIVDVNIDAFDEKPWRHPGADITDFFNFDFDEDSWKNYCNQLDQYRHGDINPARVTSAFFKHNGFYQSSTDHETIAHTSAEINRKGGRLFCKSKSLSKEQEYSNMQKGRAIQVAGSITERRSSMDTRRPSGRDSDVVIQIDVQESKEPCTLKEQIDPVNCSEQGAYENGTSGMDDDMDGLTFGSSSEDELDNESLVGDAIDEGSVMPNSERCSVRKHHPEEAALGDSEGNIKTVETLNKRKEEASRSSCNTAPTIPEVEFSHNECYQYSRSPSFSGSDCEDYRTGARHHVEKSYKCVRSPARNSLAGYQKEVPPAHHHSKNYRSQFVGIKFRDSKDAARYGKSMHQERDDLYGVFGSKSHASGYKGTSNSVSDRNYNYLEHDQSRQKDKLYGYSGYHEDELLYYRDTNFSVNFCDEKFPDQKIEDECTKYPRKKGYQKLKVPTDQFLPRNSDERAYRLRDEMLERDWDYRESSYTVDGMHPLFCQESRQLNLNYPENEIDTRWKRKGGEPQFRRRMENDIESFPEPKYLHDSSQQKYKRTGPCDVRGRNNYFNEYEERLPYIRRGAKSPVRSSRKCMEDEDDFGRSSQHRSFYSRPYRGAHTLKSSWHNTSSPKSDDTYEIDERQDIYEKHIRTERSHDIDIYGGDTETLNRGKDVSDYDDRAYSSIKRYHRQSELLHWNEDECLLMEQNDNYHAETTSFSCKRTSWNKRFNAEDRTVHARITYDMQADNINCKWMSEKDMGKQGNSSSDMYYGGCHGQALLGCGDSVDFHVVHGDEKFRGRSSAAGSVMFNGRYNNKASHLVGEQQSMSTELDKTRTKMARQVKDPDLKITHKDVNCLNGLSDTLQKALDIEEGQILTDDIMEDAMKCNISVSSNLSQANDVKRLPNENATKENVSNPRILEVIAKMEKRRERFKEPITLKDKLPEPLTGSTEDTSGTMKQQRPARKRRWGGQ